MPSVRMTLIASITQYPSIYPNVTAVADHLLLCIGNGYEWEDGCLVGMEGNDPDKRSVRTHIQRGLKKNQQAHYAKSPYRGYQACLFDFNIKNVELLIAEGIDGRTYNSYYGLHEDYSCICKLPDNIQEDWLDFAEKFANEYLTVLTQNPQVEKIQFGRQLVSVEKEVAILLKVFKRIYEIRAARKGVSYEEYKNQKVELRKAFLKTLADILKE